MNTQTPFEQVVAEHGGTIIRVCRAVLGPGADADDAWSETFLAALKAWPDRAGIGNVEAWLVTVAHRKAIDITRARARHAIPIATIPDRASAQGVPGDHGQQMWDAVAALPDKQRHAVAYHYLAGLPYRDIAEILGGTPAAARRAAADGIKTLRKTLDTAGAQENGAPNEQPRV